jgi:alpha-beta hydrolase superfamily lysophospholipase
VEPLEIRSAAGRKTPIFFGAPGRPLFGFLHAPDSASFRDVGVVLCPPLGTDATRSERTYRHLAERLAAAGYACLRYDHYGTGDSGGDVTEPGLVASWIEDVGVAVDALRARSGARTVALLGLRLGATLALAHAAQRDDVDALVLWSPCVTGAGFVSESTKLHKVYARIEPHLAGAPPPPADGEEALGLFLPRALVADLSKLDLLQTTRRPARRTLVIDGGNVAGRDPLVQRLADLGAAPELRKHPGHKFLITVSHRSLVPDEVIDSITGWLHDAYPARPWPGAPAPPVAAESPSKERPVVIEVAGGRQLFGILTPADAAKTALHRPPIVLANAGCVNRSGPHRTYVRMARRWAERGFPVLRLDLSGIGDSPVAPGATENIPYPPSGMEDLSAAIGSLASERVIVAGLCSGGDYAFQLALQAREVRAAWLLNPRTFCVLQLAAVESGTPPASPVDEVPRALRRIAEQGVDTCLVLSRNDPGVAYVDAHAGDAMRALEGVSGYHRFDIDGADHSFTPVALQERVSDLLTERLTALVPS